MSGDAPRPPVKPRTFFLALLVGTAVFLGGTALLTMIITGAIWPGEAKLWAPVLCDDAHPEAFVVSDTYSSGDGSSSIDFSLYCVSADGEAIDEGWARPWFLSWAAHSALILTVLTALRVRSLLRLTAGRGGGAGGDPTGGGGNRGGGKRRSGRRDSARGRPLTGADGEPRTQAELLDRDFPDR